MAFFDMLKKQAVQPASGAAADDGNRTYTVTLREIPVTLAQLQAMPEASLKEPQYAAALTIAALCRYEQSPEQAFEMLDFLKGPAELTGKEKQFIGERLNGKCYKVLSFFAGATPENGYKPNTPYTIRVSENPYSFDEENWATLYVTSGGADNPRPIKLRKKPSTGQWFLNDIQCLADIRVPKEEDPWA